ncbi:MAG: UDP-N-acetylmuramoyl-tripeptide--D-alanyl-D-alanine ligase [candidate division Zixibacteria bacterium]|nr:UDP-N-acetylmuramoyl-tripeptide--D-alanyl-D-alanine ligase [candidate division Zixibacteria bacterium]
MDFNTLAREVKGELVEGRFGTATFEGVSIDSRTISENQLFIAIRGENNDGHRYIGDILKRAKGGVLINRNYPELSRIGERLPIVIVDDTHLAMMQLAENYRRRLSAKFIAITGSNGKTTTKEFVYAMIAGVNESVYRSPGNLNNLFGLPLAIFAMPADVQFGIFELGISVPGEMTKLANMIKADLVLITNVGPTHLETLGTIDRVAEAKFELVDSLGPEKPVILNADIPILMKTAHKRKRKYITFGFENPADFVGRWIGISDNGYPMIEIDGNKIAIKLFGDHQTYNILAGFAVCKVLGLDIKAKNLNNIDYRLAPYRGEIESINGLTLIADCYNANPVSTKSGLLSFRRYLDHPHMKGRNGIAVIGDMLELGEKSADYHREIGVLLAQSNFALAITVGPMSKQTYLSALSNGGQESKIKHFENIESAGDFLVSNVKRGDILYLKASRGIGLEKIITLLKGSAFRQN